MGILQILDGLPDSIAQAPGPLWSVFARSLGEQGSGGRTALAWRWALTGACPSPVTLGAPLSRPPVREELLEEADAAAELARPESDPGGQVMHARFVLQWLAGALPALPLWNGGPKNLHVTDGAAYPRPRAEIDEAHHWALLARWRHPWPGPSASADAWLACGWAYGASQLLDWACGEAGKGPLTGLRSAGRPSLYQVALDTRVAMTAVFKARAEGKPVLERRVEAIMETFLWLAGWNQAPPADRHGHGLYEDCPEPGALSRGTGTA